VKKQANRHPKSRLHWLCPFCGEACDAITELRWCSGCYTEYSQSGMFNDKQKTRRFAFAKALMKSGGTRISGAPDSPPAPTPAPAD
jgi:hypothetical protein